jgi:superfamily II DNA/RNA helicase
VAALAETGITTPFPIQALTLPDALAGLDILGRGQTGSGKTLSFSIPLAARLADGYTSACRPRGLVLVPTRELASQVQAVLVPLAQAVGLSVVAIYGGVPQNPQVTRLRDRADIVVACPGRLADLIEQGHCHLGDVEISVIDEADHMADLGFLPVVRRLLDMTPPESQMSRGGHRGGRHGRSGDWSWRGGVLGWFPRPRPLTLRSRSWHAAGPGSLARQRPSGAGRSMRYMALRASS